MWNGEFTSNQQTDDDFVADSKTHEMISIIRKMFNYLNKETLSNFHRKVTDGAKMARAESAKLTVFSTVFFRYNFRPEVDNDVMSSVAVDYVGMEVKRFSRYSRS